MSRETYDKLLSKYQVEKANILKQLESFKGEISNLENYIVKALTLSSKLPVLWTSSHVGIKEKLQKLVFPGGIYYNKQKGANHSSNDFSPQAGIRLQPSNRFRNDLEEIAGFLKQLGSLMDSN